MAKLTFTADFADSPYRVAYDISERLYVVVEVATGSERNWFERGQYQAAYAEAAGLNTESAETDEIAYCEACGAPVDPAEAVLDGELMVCQGCAPCTAAEFEAMQQAAYDAAIVAMDGLAALVPDPATWVAVSAAPCEPVTCQHEGTEWVGTVNGRRSCLICEGLAPEIIPEPCPGLQFPCGKPATETVQSFTGSDFETRRGVELRYCPECAAELNYHGNSAGGFDGGADIDPDGGDDEPEWPAGATSTISRAELFDALCSSIDELRDYWRDVPRRLKALNDAWEAVLLAEAFYFNAQGDLLVPSGSVPGVVYAVGHTCPCQAGRWGGHCRHSIIADIIGRARRIDRLQKAA